MCIGWMKQLVCGNQQCPEIIIEELQQQVKVAAATPLVFYLTPLTQQIDIILQGFTTLQLNKHLATL